MFSFFNSQMLCGWHPKRKVRLCCDFKMQLWILGPSLKQVLPFEITLQLIVLSCTSSADTCSHTMNTEACLQGNVVPCVPLSWWCASPSLHYLNRMDRYPFDMLWLGYRPPAGITHGCAPCFNIKVLDKYCEIHVVLILGSGSERVQPEFPS